MKIHSALTVACLAALALTGCTDSKEAAAPAPTSSPAKKTYQDGQKATVKSVESANTVTVDIDGSTEQVRLLNVVAPSKNNNVPSGSCLIQESTDYLKKKLPAGSEVTLKFDKAQVGTSGYLDAAMYSGDQFINKQVARDGMAATTYTTQNDTFYPEISQAQQDAAKDAVGLYSKDVDCTIPHMIAQAQEKAKSAKDIKDEQQRKIAYQEASTVYNDLNDEVSAPAQWVGSIVTLEPVRQQLEELKTDLGKNYYNKEGVSEADQATASPTGRPQ
ncbi:thermonuclease family protein [Rothia sp. LK2588]|uniref:thermonuclease family protein n=1 Tax=Rothia sp. LK2588 TaxID=3114369 RepID=UPI0034CFEF55